MRQRFCQSVFLLCSIRGHLKAASRNHLIPLHWIDSMNQTRLIRRSVVLLAAFVALAVILARAGYAQTANPEKEAEFIAVLRSDAPGAEKAIACKQLAIYGS